MQLVPSWHMSSKREADKTRVSSEEERTKVESAVAQLYTILYLNY